MRLTTVLTLFIIVISIFLFCAAVFSFDGRSYHYTHRRSYVGGFFYWGPTMGYRPGGTAGTYGGGRSTGGSFRGGGTGSGK